MFDSLILDVGIGLAFVFALVSTLCSAVREGIESFMKTRASYLEFSLRELLQDSTGTGLVKHLFDHSLIVGLYTGNYEARSRGGRPRLWEGGRNLPSYIPARQFALALLDMAARGPATDAANSDPALGTPSFASIRAGISNLQNPRVQRALLCALDAAKGDLDVALTNVEAWYNGSMDRVSGWYKRSTQLVIFCIALIVACVMNINAIRIANYLYSDPVAREKVVATAGATQAEGLDYAKARATLEGLELPIGWSEGLSFKRPSTAPKGSSEVADPSKPAKKSRPVWVDVIETIGGFLITAFAATLGAPFWFDVVNKFMVIRSTVKPREKSQEEASEDRQLPTPATSQEKSPPVASQAGAVVQAAPSSANVAVAAVTPVTELDGCDHAITDALPDEELPAAKGGVG